MKDRPRGIGHQETTSGGWRNGGLVTTSWVELQTTQRSFELRRGWLTTQSAGLQYLEPQATIAQVLDCTAGGTAAKGPTLEKPSSESERLDVTKLDKNFLVPCVKSRTGWVKRSLTTKEVGKAFDVPAHVVRDLQPSTLDRLFEGGASHPSSQDFT